MRPGIFLRGGEAGDGAGLGFSLAGGMEPPPRLRLCSPSTIPRCRRVSCNGTSRCNPSQSTMRGRGGGTSGPQPQRDGVLEPPGQRHLLCPAPQVCLLRNARLKSPSRGRAWPQGCGHPGTPSPVPRAAGLRSRRTQGVPPMASFLPRQDQRQDLTWTAFY